MFGRWLAFRRRQRQKLRASNRPPLMTAPEPDDEQLENYLVAPRIMQRTVSVPGAVTVVALAGGTLLGSSGPCSRSPRRPVFSCSTRRSSSRGNVGSSLV